MGGGENTFTTFTRFTTGRETEGVAVRQGAAVAGDWQCDGSGSETGEEPSVDGDSWLLVERGHAGREGRPICVTVFGAMLTVLTALTVDLPVLCSGSLNRVLSGSGFNGLMAMA